MFNNTILKMKNALQKIDFAICGDKEAAYCLTNMHSIKIKKPLFFEKNAENDTYIPIYNTKHCSTPLSKWEKREQPWKSGLCIREITKKMTYAEEEEMCAGSYKIVNELNNEYFRELGIGEDDTKEVTEKELKKISKLKGEKREKFIKQKEEELKCKNKESDVFYRKLKKLYEKVSFFEQLDKDKITEKQKEKWEKMGKIYDRDLILFDRVELKIHYLKKELKAAKSV